jgi:hypothetical protein
VLQPAAVAAVCHAACLISDEGVHSCGGLLCLWKHNTKLASDEKTGQLRKSQGRSKAEAKQIT